jgi:dihydropteroate synthase
MSPDNRQNQGASSANAGEALFWSCGRHRLDFTRRPLVMGILNATPDSFYAHSRTTDPERIADAACVMVEAGVDILDLGAESSRPGAEALDDEEEAARLLPMLQAVRRATALPITVDTYHLETARLALDHGADGINDITAGSHDPGMLPLIAERQAGLILMHMQGKPHDMQSDPLYSDVLREVGAYLRERAQVAEDAGVAKRFIAVDPGIGFGKKLEHNLALLRGLESLASERPLLLGASRKSFIEHLTGSPVEKRLGGSLAAAAYGMNARAAVIRVHDVPETVQMLDVMAAIAGR